MNKELLYGLKNFTYTVGDISRFGKFPTYSKYYIKPKSKYISLNNDFLYNYDISNSYLDFLEELNYQLYDKISNYFNKKDIIKIYDLIPIKITNKDFTFDFINIEKFINDNLSITIDELKKIRHDDYKIMKVIEQNSKIANKLYEGKKVKKKSQIYKQAVRDILDIFLNYRYIKVNTDILIIDKVKADMADKMYNVAVKNEKEKNSDFKVAIKYLSNYYNDNKKNYGNFHQSKIADYLNKLNDIKKKEEINNKKNIEKVQQYNYNFFEDEGYEFSEILSHIVKFNNPKNTDKLKEVLKRKLDLYNSIGYSKIKIGRNSYDGYIGFVIGDKVILDRLFLNLKSYTIAIDNAIYIIKEEDFDEITKLPKYKVIDAINNNLIDARRIIHNGKYESKVLQYVKK